jgi:hypothetical protein
MAKQDRQIISRKGVNGSGDSIVIHLDPDDPADARALEMAKLLASKHGRRKAVIVALLEAMHAQMERTGRVMTPVEVAAAIMNQPTNLEVAAPAPRRAALPKPAGEPKPAKLSAADKQAMTQRAAEEVASNYLNSMANLFD